MENYIAYDPGLSGVCDFFSLRKTKIEKKKIYMTKVSKIYLYHVMLNKYQ